MGSGLEDWVYWHLFTTIINYNSSQSATKIRSIPHWTTSIFSSAVTDLVLIYGSVASSASIVRWLTLHSWTMHFFRPSHECSNSLAQRQVKIKVTLRPTVSRPVAWCQAHIWGLRPDFNFCQTVAVCWFEALSLTRERVCRLQLLLVLASSNILGSESRRTRDHILLSQIRDSFKPGGPGPHIYITQKQGGPVILPGTGF
jgi:hypothetical protein